MPANISVNNSIAITWLIFFAYWAGEVLYELATRRTKQVEKREPLAVALSSRLTLWIAVFLVLTTFAQKYYPFGASFLPSTFITAYTGLAVGFCGIFFAIWARITLGGNWSADAVLKKGQTLVKNGPYGIVRHPIYTGITIGIVGPAIAENTVTGLIAIFFVLLFSYFRIKDEEKLMKEKFGSDYADYAKKVKAFVPWIL
jgi:protein-S-isoprenylcysteine O-methyltransferase Ste14